MNKNLKQLEVEESIIDQQIRYMEKVLAESNKPETVKLIANEALIDLRKKKQTLINEIIRLSTPGGVENS